MISILIEHMNMTVECLKINQQCLYGTLNQLLFTSVKFIMSKITAIQTHRLVDVSVCGMNEYAQTDWDF